jgi:hypothetical protein
MKTIFYTAKKIKIFQIFVAEKGEKLIPNAKVTKIRKLPPPIIFFLFFLGYTED